MGTRGDPGGTSKTYDYIPGGARLSQDITTSGTTTLGYYSYNAHSGVEALTGTTWTTTYGYTAYGDPVASPMTAAYRQFRAGCGEKRLMGSLQPSSNPVLSNGH